MILNCARCFFQDIFEEASTEKFGCILMVEEGGIPLRRFALNSKSRNYTGLSSTILGDVLFHN